MKMPRLTPLAPVLVLFASATGYAGPNRYFADARFPSEVQAAHELFYQGKFDAMVVQIKAALLKYPRDPAVKQDVLELYDAAYELKGDSAITPDYRLPESVTWMSVGVKKRLRAATGTISHRLIVSLDFRRESEIEQLRVVRYPDVIILDKRMGIGQIEISDDEDGQKNAWIASPMSPDAVEDGLYLIDLKMKGSANVAAYVILSRMVAKNSPEMTSPTVEQIVTEATPTISYRSFISAEYRNFERRKLFVAVESADGNGPDLFQYSHPSKDPIPNSVRVNKPLVSGDYIARVSFRERREFGPITLSRESDTSVPFSVRLGH